MTEKEIQGILKRQREYFSAGHTLSAEARLAALRKLKTALQRHEADLAKALHTDLGKSETESYMCETGLTLSEASWMIRHLRRLMRDRTVPTPLAQFAARSFRSPSPYGNVLIMSPWNYPVLLTLDPLIDAIAAGNTAIVKPSAYAPATAAVLQMILEECFPPEYVCIITGGRAENQALLRQKFDMIFFTGSKAVGKEVLRCVAVHLTPAVLELGGKSPCIVEKSAKIALAAKRTVFGKYLNCGQTCVAPDYLLVHEDVADELCRLIEQDWRRFYGDHPLECEYWPHMISDRHFKRVMGLIANHNPNAKVACGGHGDERTLKIEPTIMRGVTLNDPVMGEEIFGPVLPVITYRTLDEAMRIARTFPHPLACYVFTGSKRVEQRVIHELQFGGGAVNDVCVHMSNNHMGFGGVGNSGMGAYHGKVGFDTFTHYKSVMKHGTWLDPTVRYPPFTPVKKAIAHLLMH